MKRFSFLATLLGVLLLGVACSRSSVYNHFYHLPASGWAQDSAACFDVMINDTLSYHDILLNIRHTGDYPYQNIWLFVHSTSPSGIAQDDTLSCYLASNRGKWLGTHYPSQYEMPLLYMQHIQFPEAGTYHFEVLQAMRDSALIGVSSLGLQIKTITDGKE